MAFRQPRDSTRVWGTITMPPTHQRLSRTLTVGVLASFLTLTLAGCGEDEMAATSATPPAEAPANAAEPDTPDASDATADPTTPDAGDTADADPLASAQGCFLGSWTLDVASHQSLMDEASSGNVQNASGLVTVTFADDGTVTTEYDDWHQDIIVEMAGVSQTESMLRNGVDTGTYNVTDDGVAVITDTSVDSEVESVATSLTGDVTTTTENTGFSMFRTAPMTCEGDTIDVDVMAGIVNLNRAG